MLVRIIKKKCSRFSGSLPDDIQSASDTANNNNGGNGGNNGGIGGGFAGGNGGATDTSLVDNGNHYDFLGG